MDYWCSVCGRSIRGWEASDLVECPHCERERRDKEAAAEEEERRRSADFLMMYMISNMGQ